MAAKPRVPEAAAPPAPVHGAAAPPASATRLPPRATEAAPHTTAQPRAADHGVRGARRLRRFELLARAEIAAASFLVWALLRVLRATVTIERHGAEELERCWKSDQRVLMAFWHGRSIMLPFFYAGPGACIMNSTHRDGEIVTRALARFGIESTRGSSSRGAVVGALGLVRAFRRGRDLALIPDGPRGPAGRAKAGVAELGLQTGAPIFPIAVSCSKALRLRTWDRLMLPRPGSRVVVVVGDPLRPCAASHATRAAAPERERQREHLRAELELRLRNVTAAADRLAGRAAEET